MQALERSDGKLEQTLIVKIMITRGERRGEERNLQRRSHVANSGGGFVVKLQSRPQIVDFLCCVTATVPLYTSLCNIYMMKLTANDCVVFPLFSLCCLMILCLNFSFAFLASLMVQQVGQFL